MLYVGVHIVWCVYEVRSVVCVWRGLWDLSHLGRVLCVCFEYGHGSECCMCVVGVGVSGVCVWCECMDSRLGELAIPRDTSLALLLLHAIASGSGFVLPVCSRTMQMAAPGLPCRAAAEFDFSESFSFGLHADFRCRHFCQDVFPVHRQTSDHSFGKAELNICPPVGVRCYFLLYLLPVPS